MSNYYFTFGSDERFPFGRNDYVMVQAQDGNRACDLFRERHPNRPGSNCINCAFIYSEEKFNAFRDRFYPYPPVEIIREGGANRD